ncbi:MAG: M1 family metallopeptidase [Anaerolineales bacterium]
MKRAIVWLLLAALLAACAAGVPTATQTEPSFPSIPSASPTSPQPTVEATVVTSRPHTPAYYTLNVNFDYATHYLSVDEIIEYTNNSADSLSEVQLVVEADRSGAGFDLLDLKANGSSITLPELSQGILRVPLQTALEPGQAVTLEIEFGVALSPGPGVLHWTQRQKNFVDWYPYIPPYVSGQGWLMHEGGQVGEHGVYESADFDVHIKVVNAPASLSLATPALGIANGEGWDYRLHNARRFVWSAGGQYQQLHSQQDGVPISIYFFEEQRDAAEASLEVAKQALGIYGELYGPYSYESLAIVEAEFADGMESDGLFFLDQFYFQSYSYDRRNYLTALTAHEIAHNWWFGQVGNDQALEPWLDEALCIYSELLYYEKAYPELVEWWWEFRIDRFRPVGWVNSTIYEFTQFSPYVHAVYMRGAQFLHAVRGALGDEAFFAFLRAWAEEGAGKIVTAEDFFTLLRQYGDAELDPIIGEYFVPPN